MLVVMIIYQEFLEALPSQVPLPLQDFLEVQQAHIPPAQSSHLVLVCLKALVDLSNLYLHLCQGKDTRKWMRLAVSTIIFTHYSLLTVTLLM